MALRMKKRGKPRVSKPPIDSHAAALVKGMLKRGDPITAIRVALPGVSDRSIGEIRAGRTFLKTKPTPRRLLPPVPIAGSIPWPLPTRIHEGVKEASAIDHFRVHMRSDQRQVHEARAVLQTAENDLLHARNLLNQAERRIRAAHEYLSGE